MNRILAAFAGLTGLAVSSVANASATINFSSTVAVPATNDFQSSLSSLGLSRIAANGADIVLDSNSLITFYFLGSESGFSDTFQTTNALPNTSSTENSSFESHFGSPVLIGSDTFGPGSLVNQLLFTNNGGTAGLSATVGQTGFGIFLAANALSGSSTNTFYFGYDDQAVRPDGDYDDYIVRADVHTLPEPGTWATMLLGFGAIGFAMRRRRKSVTMQAA
jgi:PEP-CTERM motif-containing protein